ncbi:NAD(+)/NADH kinase [bacterium]|nr:NAD(+)/NADH kinase [bacterium]
MGSRINKIGIFANLEKPELKDNVTKLINLLSDQDVPCFLENSLAGSIGMKGLPLNELIPGVDLLIILGGDGTMLRVARMVKTHETPMLGVNIGHLGFLTELLPEEVENALPKIISGEYRIVKRMMLKVEIKNGETPPLYALNEVVIDKGPSPRLLLFNIFISGQFVSRYSSDGIIISTPTGSTAYSMAAGGAILDPEIEALLITPLSPYTLAIRPMVIGMNEKIRITFQSRGKENAKLTIDGQEGYKIPIGVDVEVSKAEFSANFLNYQNRSFYEVLRTKLGWGRAPGERKQ